MKKLIAVLTLLLAFTINANAQDKKMTPAADKAKTDTAELTKYLGLTETQSVDFQRLLEQKQRTLSQSDLTEERKVELARVIEAKIRASLDVKQTEKLEQNPALLQKVTH